MSDSEIHDVAAKIHQIEHYADALEYASEIAQLRAESDEDDQEIKRLALENMRLKGAVDLLHKIHYHIRHIRTDSYDVNALIERVSAEIAEHLGIDPEEEE